MAFTSGLTITVNNFIVKATAIGKKLSCDIVQPENSNFSNFFAIFL